MSVFNNTIRKSPQHPIGCGDYGISQRTYKLMSLMHVGISAFCLPIFNQQNKSYASDRDMT